MSKPRKNHLQKTYIRINDDTPAKKSKPWNKKAVAKERGIFDNVTLSDLNEGMTNRGNAKKFARHQFRQRME